MKLHLIAAAAFLALSGGASAYAGDLLFTYTGDVNGSFTVDSSPTVTFQIAPTVTFPTGSLSAGGFDTTTSVGTVAFFEAPQGGFAIGDDIEFTGAQLFTGQDQGPTPDPMFSTGTFTLINANSDSDATETLVISDAAVSSAPEPSTWALMLGGVGILGCLLRVAQARRREDQASGMAEA